MTAAALDAAGRALYDACPAVKPSWDMLGNVTKSVWMERVCIESSVKQPLPAPAKPAPVGHMESLF